MSKYELLENITSPQDIQDFDEVQTKRLCAEIREKILETTAQNGGHVASNLGVVELSVVLHQVFHSPEDEIVFDVGHQCYAHKLLTGRFARFDTLRTKGGISGFTNPMESEHDIFYSGHSSTSISAACGLARAKKLKGEKGYVIAVIGDGSLTGGEAYEGLNNAYSDADNLIIVINDNKMSISSNKSSLASSLAKIRSTKGYYKSRERFQAFLRHIPLIGIPLRNTIVKSKYALKGALYHSSFFEDLGYAYLGPVDGHNIARLKNIFEVAKLRGKPCVVHIETIKGKGYTPAEKKPQEYHGISAHGGTYREDYSAVFGKKLTELAKKNEKIFAITAAMPQGTGLTEFAKIFKNRFLFILFREFLRQVSQQFSLKYANTVRFRIGLHQGRVIDPLQKSRLSVSFLADQNRLVTEVQHEVKILYDRSQIFSVCYGK